MGKHETSTPKAQHLGTWPLNTKPSKAHASNLKPRTFFIRALLTALNSETKALRHQHSCNIIEKILANPSWKHLA